MVENVSSSSEMKVCKVFVLTLGEKLDLLYKDALLAAVMCSILL